MSVDKLVDSTQLNADLTSVANAIRTKGGTSASLDFPADFVSAIAAIPTGGGDTLSALLDNTLTAFSYTGTAPLPWRLLYNKTAVISVYAPNTEEIGERTFSDAVNVASFNLDSLERIVGASASSQGYAFSAFGRDALTVIHLPKLKTITMAYAMPYLGKSSNYQTVVLPALENVGSDCWRNGYLNALDLGEGVSALNTRAIYQGECKKLILRKADGVVTIGNTNNVGVGGIGGLNNSSIVYVPQSLISSYEASSNWAAAKASSGHNFTFAAIEGSAYETAYADGTPIPT